MTTRRTISTKNAPAAIGPYNQAVVGAGVVYCSGQIALDPATGKLVEGDVAAQAEQVLTNMRAVLEAAGTGMDRVLKCQVFLRDMADFKVVNEVYTRAFEGIDPPARACVAVAGLPMDVDVEIDCVALCD